MKKKTKLNLVELIIAVVFIAAAASAQIVRCDAEGNRINAAGHKINQYNVECEPDCFYTTEYFRFTLNWQGAAMKNDKLEHARKQSVVVLRMRTDNGVKTARWLYNVNGELQEEPVAFHSFEAVALSDGTRQGYFVVDCKLDGSNDARGNGIPAATVRICGELKLQWNESRRHWESVSGTGYAVGWSEGGRIDQLTENATYCNPSKDLLPIRATVNVSTANYWTIKQLLNFAPKKSN